MNEVERVEHQPWPMRPLILLGLGALAGLLVYFLLGIGKGEEVTGDPLRLGAAAFFVVGGIALALTLERLRWTWSAGFAAAAGVAVGLVTAFNGDPDKWISNQGWRFAASLLAVAIAVPIFQALRDSGGRRLEPRSALDHAWTDAILWALACAFLLAVWLLLVLLGGLFGLIGIDSVKDLILKPWFMLMLCGGTLGASIALLRDRDSVIGLIHRSARTTLSVLAPFLGIGLLLFVAALAFTGLQPLWRETEATTPILLACILAALLLANAAIGNSEEEEPKVRIIGWGAMALAAAMLPLAIVAAISMGKRIGQYGFSPDRLWAAIVVAAALIVSAAYLFALVRGRRNWAPLLRRANVAIAAGIGIIAYLLALPILDFGAVSARDQVARLNAGRIAPDKFDWRAMRFEFGESGREALQQLTRTGRTAEIKLRASFALRQDHSFSPEYAENVATKDERRNRIRVLPQAIDLPPALTERLVDYNHCRNGSPCLVLYRASSDRAVVIAGPECPEPDDALEDTCRTEVSAVRLKNGGWGPDTQPLLNDAQQRALAKADLEAMSRNQVEIRSVERHQVFIGDRPVGDVFE